MSTTRELLRQTQQTLDLLVKGTGVTVSLGEKGKVQKTHIVVASPGFIKNNIEGRQASLNVEHIKMVIFDEADEVFIN